MGNVISQPVLREQVALISKTMLTVLVRPILSEINPPRPGETAPMSMAVAAMVFP